VLDTSKFNVKEQTMSLKQHHTCTIKTATVDDVPIILGFIKELADYEN
jgi:hypothetical protein